MDDERPASAPNLGLRERNRQRAMLQIQDVALDLFDERGFANVTVEHVAAEAGVSPSTVYRYFGTKDRLVLHDEEDRIMVDVLLNAVREGATLIDAARQVVVAMTPLLGPGNTSLRRRFRYMLTERTVERTVQAEMVHETRAAASQVAAELCRIHGRPPGDLEVAIAATGLVNTLFVAAEAWQRVDFKGDYAAILSECLDILEAGVTL